MLGQNPVAITMTTSKGYSPLVLARKNNKTQHRDYIISALAKEEEVVMKMPLFKNFREAEERSTDQYKALSTMTFV